MSLLPTIDERIAALLAQDDAPGMRDVLVALLERHNSAEWLRKLDDAGLLTRIVPELEPARDTDQPRVHFLPVLAHSLETVAVVDWLLGQLAVVSSQLSGASPIGTDTTDYGLPTTGLRQALPVAVQSYPQLRYRSVYAAELRAHFAEMLGEGRSRAALFRLGALLHDVAKPQTKQPKPGGGVSFHDHQTIGGEVALEVAQRLRFSDSEAAYIATVVREHMRPGQFAALDQVTLRAVRRFFHATGHAGPDVLLHSLADHMATRGPNLDVAAWHAQAQWTDALLDVIWGDESEPVAPLINGNDLMRALGIGPGPQVGRLLAAIGEAQAGGDITTPEEALALARRLIRDESVKR
jgi:poly(A) polymerase/tRNA nucleotidyltransferase (CCA-adding enzyme)